MDHPPAKRPPPDRLNKELTRLRRYGLIIIDEVGYLPFEPDAANLFFQLVSSRYEHASLILTSNLTSTLTFAAWADVFGDQAVAAAMIDRIVHHAEVISLKGHGIDSLHSTTLTEKQTDETAKKPFTIRKSKTTRIQPSSTPRLSFKSKRL